MSGDHDADNAALRRFTLSKSACPSCGLMLPAAWRTPLGSGLSCLPVAYKFAPAPICGRRTASAKSACACAACMVACAAARLRFSRKVCSTKSRSTGSCHVAHQRARSCAFSGCPIAPACSPVCSNDGGTATRLGTSVFTAQAASASGIIRARSLVGVCMVFAFWVGRIGKGRAV